MSIITMPEGLPIAKMSWNQQRMVTHLRSAFGRQTIEGAPPLWSVSMDFDRMTERESGLMKALLLRLRGPANQLAVWDVARPAPTGTLRGAWAMNGMHAQGAVVLSIAAGSGQFGKTLMAGDWIGLGSGLTQQLVMVMDDAAADETGNISVSIEPPLRNSFSTGTPLVWDKPTAVFRMQNDKLGWDYEKTFASGFSLDLLEDVRP